MNVNNIPDTPLSAERLTLAWENADTALGSIVCLETLSNYESLAVPMLGQDLKTFVRGNQQLQACFPIPRPLMKTKEEDIQQKMHQIQRYLGRLGYNHLGVNFYEVKKASSFRHLMRTAQEIIHYGLPIKCLEAVVVAGYLSLPCRHMDRIPLAFKSESFGKVYRHIVLVCKYRAAWGALGLSRKQDLMYKPLRYTSLPELVKDFLDSYRKNHHQVLKLKIGLPMLFDASSNESIAWKHVSVDTHGIHHQDWSSSDVYHQLESFSKMIRMLTDV